jgi:hypothetical protein
MRITGITLQHTLTVMPRSSPVTLGSITHEAQGSCTRSLNFNDPNDFDYIVTDGVLDDVGLLTIIVTAKINPVITDCTGFTFFSDSTHFWSQSGTDARNVVGSFPRRDDRF